MRAALPIQVIDAPPKRHLRRVQIARIHAADDLRDHHMLVHPFPDALNWSHLQRGCADAGDDVVDGGEVLAESSWY